MFCRGGWTQLGDLHSWAVLDGSSVLKGAYNVLGSVYKILTCFETSTEVDSNYPANSIGYRLLAAGIWIGIAK